MPSLPWSASHEFAAHLSSSRRARRWAAGELSAQGWPDTYGRLESVLGELVINAVMHGQGTVLVTLRGTGDDLRVEVHDAGAGTVAPRPPDDDGGRGLHIVDALSEQWGVGRDLGGNTVWAVLRRGDLPGPAAV